MRLTPPPCLAHKSTGRALAWTDFASAGFTEGSTPEGWTGVRSQLEARGKLFLPSVGPGYNDTLIRPWNAAQTKGRERGRYYDQMWGQALQTASGGVTITSYNEWGEGEQPALTLVPYCPGFGAQEQAGRSARQGRSREWQPDEATAPFRPCEPRAAREPTYMIRARTLRACAGTQIEPARPHQSSGGSQYEDYSPDASDFYLNRTRHWAAQARRGCEVQVGSRDASKDASQADGASDGAPSSGSGARVEL